MKDYLHSGKYAVIRENFNEEDKLSQYLENQAPIILQEDETVMPGGEGGLLEPFSDDLIIPPLNTDIRFSEHLPLHSPTQEEAEGQSHSHSHAIVKSGGMQMQRQSSDDLIIPPLNTDIRFSEHLPLHSPTQEEAEGQSHSHPHAIVKESFYDIPQNFTSNLGSYDPRQHDHPSDKHPHELHTHEHTHENFSWAIPTHHDSALDLVKKSLIHKVSTQHACGSCWDT